jgi:hypothetical protein
MTNYHVNFLKDLINSNVRLFRTRQGSIDIHSARTQERAIQAAQRRFARIRGVSNWVLYADRLEIEASAEEAAIATMGMAIKEVPFSAAAQRHKKSELSRAAD